MADLDPRFFSAPKDCHNCESKQREYFDTSSLKRCSKCKLMTYCNKDCQLEHWYRHHKSVCKLISGKKADKVKVHPKFCGTVRLKSLKNGKVNGHDTLMEDFGCEQCKVANQKGYDEVTNPLSPVTSCHIGCFQLNVKWAMLRCFQYDENFLEMKVSDTYPIPINYPCGEYTGQYLEPRYIDEGLANLFRLFENLRDKYFVTLGWNDSLNNVLKWLIKMRGTFWYFKLIGKSNKQIMCFIGDYMYKSFHDDKLQMDFQNIDAAFHSDGVLYPWWGACLVYLNKFALRLSWSDKLVLLDENTLSSNSTPLLCKLLTEANRLYAEPFPVELPRITTKNEQQILMSPILHESLPEGTNCHVCSKNLAGTECSWFLTKLNFYTLGCNETDKIFMDGVNRFTKENHWHSICLHVFVLCSSVYCLQRLGHISDQHTMSLKHEIESFFKSLTVCDFCDTLSRKVHRCSSCKSRVYCRQECLDEDWKSVHQFVCQNMRADPRRKIRKPLKNHVIAGVTVPEIYEEVD